MKLYSFFSRDYFSNNGNHSISGDHYYVLLNHCFQFSRFFSITAHKKDCILIKELEHLQVTTVPFSITQNLCNARIFYSACKQSHDILVSCGQNLLDDVYGQEEYHPENLSFYRADGSVFFEALNHEGEYCLYLRPEENIDAVLEFGHWLAMDEFGNPEAPACEHQLTPVLRSSVLSDPLYILLQKIRYTPYSYICSSTIQELNKFIKNYRPMGFHNFPAELDSLLSFTPEWYKSFELYVLDELNSMTNTPIINAFEKAGYSDKSGFNKFYEFLDNYLSKICHD